MASPLWNHQIDFMDNNIEIAWGLFTTAWKEMCIDISRLIVHFKRTLEAIKVRIGYGPESAWDVFVVFGPLGELGPS